MKGSRLVDVLDEQPLNKKQWDMIIGKLKKLGTVENSTHIPRGMLEFWLDPESPYYKNQLSPDKPKILFCASNWRSALAVKALNDMGFENISHVKGGFEALIHHGFKLQKI